MGNVGPFGIDLWEGIKNAAGGVGSGVGSGAGAIGNTLQGPHRSQLPGPGGGPALNNPLSSLGGLTSTLVAEAKRKKAIADAKKRAEGARRSGVGGRPSLAAGSSSPGFRGSVPSSGGSAGGGRARTPAGNRPLRPAKPAGKSELDIALDSMLAGSLNPLTTQRRQLNEQLAGDLEQNNRLDAMYQQRSNELGTQAQGNTAAALLQTAGAQAANDATRAEAMKVLQQRLGADAAGVTADNTAVVNGANQGAVNYLNTLGGSQQDYLGSLRAAETSASNEYARNAGLRNQAALRDVSSQEQQIRSEFPWKRYEAKSAAESAAMQNAALEKKFGLEALKFQADEDYRYKALDSTNRFREMGLGISLERLKQGQQRLAGSGIGTQLKLKDKQIAGLDKFIKSQSFPEITTKDEASGTTTKLRGGPDPATLDELAMTFVTSPYNVGMTKKQAIAAIASAFPNEYAKYSQEHDGARLKVTSNGEIRWVF